MRWTLLLPVAALLTLAACDRDGERDALDRDATATTNAGSVDPAAERRGVATAHGSGRGELSAEELESGRFDDSWRRYLPRRDSDGGPADRARAAGQRDAAAESWDDISPDRVNAPPALPLSGDVAGPSVVHVQILLDQARFSPGIIDGRWGKNTEKAIYWFQETHGLPATGDVDRATFDALSERRRGQPVRAHRLSERFVEGPFTRIPEDIYERAELDCLCYESLREKLGEVFHSTPDLLEQLNPGVDLNALAAGDQLNVPAVDPFRVGDLPEGEYTDGGEVTRIVVSDGGHYLHAFDDRGNRLYHFPTTLGDDYMPSPDGEWVVESVTFHPDWHYQPAILRDVDDDEEEAIIPAGPNNDVGIVWMALSKPHYGIHGTRAPETIGYSVSSGCVRLTNWDAAFLARRVAEGVRVEFTDVARAGG